MRTPLRLLATFAFAVCFAGAAAVAADWPHVRGPAYDGTVSAPGTFEADELGLDVAWRIPLGSGYSGVAISGDRAITAFSDDDGNWVAAYDVKNLRSHR